MTIMLDGFVPYNEDDAAKYSSSRWWLGLTLGDLLDKAADVYPHKEAFVDGQSRLTFSQARNRADRLAVKLLGLGIKPLDRVLVQLPNWNEFIYAYFALQKIGAICVLLIDRYRQHEVAHLAELSGARAWIVPERFRKIDFRPIVKDVVAQKPQLEKVILVRGESEDFENLGPLVADEGKDGENRRMLAQYRPDPGQVAHMGPTGGTTGLPKIVPRTHLSLICGAEYAALAWNYTSEDTCLLPGPVGHDLTFTKGLLGGLFNLARIILLDSVGTEDICRAIEREKVTAGVWVPTITSRLIHYEHLAEHDLSSFSKLHSGGGLSQPDLVRKAREKLGCTYYNGYGGTEGQTTITRAGDDLEIICATVGRPTCPYDRYKVLDPMGRELPEGAAGELVIKGPGVFTGYFNNPEENGQVFTPDGFFKTGDLAQIDSRGYVKLTGRIKEMINRGGESISATAIEGLITEHPEVVLCAVIPMPDSEMGEKVCAYVQPSPGSYLSFSRIIDFLKDNKAAVSHLPERIEFVEWIPRTKTEKVDKRALRKDIEEKLLTEGKA